MFGCYRKGDANDPLTYVAAIAAMLAHYPEDVIMKITHPAEGLPSKLPYLPSVSDVKGACDEFMRPQLEHEARQKRIAQQLKERQEWENFRR